MGGFTTRLVLPGSKAARCSSYLYRSNREGIRYLCFPRSVIPSDLTLAGVFYRGYVPVLIMCFTGKCYVTARRIFIDQAFNVSEGWGMAKKLLLQLS